MHRLPLPTRERIHQIFDYDSITGLFTWKIRTSKRIRVDDIAGSINHWGRRVIRIDNQLYYSNRLAWLHHYGEPVPEEIDHRDENKMNDAIDNLRDFTRGPNVANRVQARVDSISNVRGVWARPNGTYSAYVKRDGIMHRYGTHKTLEAAIEAREKGFAEIFPEIAKHR